MFGYSKTEEETLKIDAAIAAAEFGANHVWAMAGKEIKLPGEN